MWSIKSSSEVSQYHAELELQACASALEGPGFLIQDIVTYQTTEEGLPLFVEPHALFLLSLAEVCLSGVAVWNNFSSLQKFRQLHFPEQSASDLQCRSSIAYWRWKETKKWQHISSRSVLALCLWLILILMAFTQVTHAKDQLQLRCSSWCQGLSNHESISASIDSFLRKPKPLQ